MRNYSCIGAYRELCHLNCTNHLLYFSLAAVSATLLQLRYVCLTVLERAYFDDIQGVWHMTFSLNVCFLQLNEYESVVHLFYNHISI